VERGRRADGIVRSMLQHSRGSSEERQPTDLNALAEEALNLAYHGARSQDPDFDIALEHDLDSNLAPVDVVPKEPTRVFERDGGVCQCGCGSCRSLPAAKTGRAICALGPGVGSGARSGCCG